MKSVQWILNIAFVLLISYLLITQNKTETADNSIAQTEQDSVKQDNPAFHIRYINSDTLYKKYDLVNQMRKDLESRQKQFSNSLESKVRKFESEVQNFQQSAQGMSQFEGQQKQKELLEKEQELGRMQQDLSDQLLGMENEMHKKIRDKIFSHLSKYKEEGIDLILDYSASSSLLMASDSLNITQEVLNTLNQEYAKEKELK